MKIYSDKDTLFLRRAAFVSILGIYLIRYCSHTLLHQLYQPVLIFPSIDVTYWLFHFIGIPQFLTQHYSVALGFDLLLLASILSALIYQRKVVFPILYLLLASCYFITFNSYATHHFHITMGMLFIALPFCFPKADHFSAAWYFLRIYYLYIFFSASLWKIFRGSAWKFDQLTNIIRSNCIEALAYNKETFSDKLDFFLLAHPAIAYTFFLFTCLLQLSFIAGLFTYKYDRYFFYASILFHVGNFFVLRINSFELLVFNLALIKPGRFDFKI